MVALRTYARCQFAAFNATTLAKGSAWRLLYYRARAWSADRQITGEEREEEKCGSY